MEKQTRRSFLQIVSAAAAMICISPLPALGAFSRDKSGMRTRIAGHDVRWQVIRYSRPGSPEWEYHAYVRWRDGKWSRCTVLVNQSGIGDERKADRAAERLLADMILADHPSGRHLLGRFSDESLPRVAARDWRYVPRAD